MILIGHGVANVNVQEALAHTQEASTTSMHMFRKFQPKCRNPSIWLATKARGLRGCGPKSRPGSHITYSRECKECEGMSPHTPK